MQNQALLFSNAIHSSKIIIDSESEEEDVVGASFDWTGDSTLTLDVSSNFQIY